MAIVTTKSGSIVNLDASPIITNTVGEGAPGLLRVMNDSLTGVIGDLPLSVYRLVRIPTDAKIKRLLISTFGATGTSAGDIDVAFSDSLTDGTQPSLSQLANPVVQVAGAVDNKLFGAAQALNGAAPPVTPVEKTFAGTAPNTFTAAHQNLPLWQVLVNLGATQFTADPGGFFDIAIKLTTAVAVANIIYNIEVDYVE